MIRKTSRTGAQRGVNKGVHGSTAYQGKKKRVNSLSLSYLPSTGS